MVTGPVVLRRYRPKPCRGLLCRQITLGLGEQLIADHELAHRCRSQQRRIEVGVQLPMVAVIVVEGAPCQPIEYGNGFRRGCRTG